MQLLEEVRANCRAIALGARHVSIDLDGWSDPPQVGPTAAPAWGADHLLQLDAINFGSGWFPTLRKRPGLSGYRTVEAAFREHGPWDNDELRRLDASTVAGVL